jgi:hypothetical protein
LLPSFSPSWKKSEYEDRDEVEEAEEIIESGDEESDFSEAIELKPLSGGNRTAMVPPKVGLLDSPHILSRYGDKRIGFKALKRERIMWRKDAG